MGRIFEGWITGERQDRDKLLELGVKGKVKYNKKTKCFEHCEVDEDIVETLKENYPQFWSPAFTYISPDGRHEFLDEV